MTAPTYDHRAAAELVERAQNLTELELASAHVLIEQLAAQLAAARAQLGATFELGRQWQQSTQGPPGVLLLEIGRMLDAIPRLPACANHSPPWFTGRWRDWHRGHGCEKDDGQPRTPEGAAEIAAGPPPTAPTKKRGSR